ncbi:MAG: PD40 domain-containing protein [Opitutaceae bacterium]|nr:PD40 domain-containing protein [Opitutaceae bacterium]
MQHLLRICLFALVALVPVYAQTRAKAGEVKLGEVKVAVDAAVAVRVTASNAELQTLALMAFSSHGGFRIEGSRPQFDIKFTAVAPTQVRVDILSGLGGALKASQVVTGSTPRQALLRAADFAVEKTNGVGLRGFFTARLAFVSQRGGRGEVLVSDLYLGEAKQLTHDNALVLTPRWAPDGSRVIFTSYFRSGAPDIFTADAATGRRETIVSLRGTNTGARFSPNGQQIAMTLSGSGSPEIFVANAQGKQIAARTRSDSAKSSPCWSPDGSQILFVMEPGPQLYVMPASGGAPRRLSLGYSYAAEPDWSRTKRNLIVFTVRVAGGRYQIATHDLATGQTKQVSKASFDAVEPSWLADGRHIVYTARDRTSTQLAILDTETGKSTSLSSFGAAALQASVWTP